jgi:hypothetical protein
MRVALRLVSVLSVFWLVCAGNTIGAHSESRSVSHQFQGVSPARVLAAAGEQLTLPAADAERNLASVVAVDIDADGDRDAVGLDWTSGLVVWINDGSGTLTRHAPAASASISNGSWTVDGGAAPDSHTSDQDGRFTLELAPASSIAGESASRAIPGSSDRLTTAPVRRVRSRGPPLLLA